MSHHNSCGGSFRSYVQRTPGPDTSWESSRERRGPVPVECPFPRRNARGERGPFRTWGVRTGRETVMGQGGSDI